jgi:PAS domain S-box-containing protein
MNTSFLAVEADYIQFLSGLAFWVLAFVSFSLRRIPTPLLSWTSLGWFGILFGCCEWVESASYSMGRAPALDALHSVLFAGATVFLLLFPAKELLPRWVSRSWLRTSVKLLPLAILALVIDVGGVEEYELAVFFFLAAVATYCAHRIWRVSRVSRVSDSPLALATVSMVLLALAFLAGAPKGRAFPASVLNRETFAAVVGFPVTCVYVVVALLLAASLWQIYQCAARNETRGGLVRRASTFGLQVLGALVLLAYGGWLLTRQSGEQARRKYGDDLMARATAIAAALDRTPVFRLGGTVDDLKLPEYRYVHDLLTRIQKSSPDVRNIYLYGPRGGGSINYVASVQSGQGEDIGPGTVYAEQLDDEDRQFFQSGVPYVSKPYTDQWGTWVSALVGVLPDPAGSGQLKLGLGLDIPALMFDRRVAEARFRVILQIALLSVIILGAFQFRQNWWDRTRQLELNQAVVMELSRQDFGSFSVALEHVTRTLAVALGVGAVSIWRRMDDGASLICEESYALSKDRHERGMVMKMSRYPRYFQALESRLSLNISDIRADERTRELAEGHLQPSYILSLLESPILLGGKFRGTLRVEHVETIRIWTADEIQLVLAIVDMVALLMEKDERRSIEAQKHESEERYRRIFEYSPEAIMVLDVHDRLLELNCRAAEITGFPVEVLVGKAIFDWPCFAQESQVRVVELMRFCKAGGSVPPCEIELRARDGGGRTGLFCAAPLRGQDGVGFGNIVILSDITESKQREAMLTGTLKELERHNRLMSGREMRILELKQEINGLRAELGRPPAYQSVLVNEAIGNAGA